MPHRVEAIANEFVRRARGESRSLTNMQLQKLPYIAHGWALALMGSGLVRESPKAFPYGPVYPRLYDALKRYGSGEVRDYIRTNDVSPASNFSASRGEPLFEELSKDEMELIDSVWKAYKTFHAYSLSEMTHGQDSPWTIATRDGGPYSVITDDIIKAHYIDIAKNRAVTK